MADPATIPPDHFEFLATRTLRAAGANVDHPHMLELAPGEPDAAEYTLRLTTTLHDDATDTKLLLECRCHERPVDADDLQALTARFAAHRIVVFATSGYDDNALACASELGLVLFRVLDAQARFAEWGYGANVPAWMPEFTAERVGGVPLTA